MAKSSTLISWSLVKIYCFLKALDSYHLLRRVTPLIAYIYPAFSLP